MIFEGFKSDLDTAFKALTPMIIVIIPGVNRFGGSFFVDSIVTGNWSEFVVTDVVTYMDANYRTLPRSAARGIAGHSMGGFGALDIAMRHADTFGSVFAMSAGLVGAQGIEDTQIFDSTAHIKSFIAATDSIKNLSKPAALLALDRANTDFNVGFDIAYGMAFAPLATPPYFEYPYRIIDDTLVRDDVILAKWEAGFGAVHQEIDTFKVNLSSLRAIGIDCGINDEYQWIVRGCSYFNSALTAAGISHSYTTHQGRHSDQIRSRVLDMMLPFFAQHLKGK